MSKVAIRVQNLSKKYQIRVARERHDTLRDQIAHRIASFFSNQWRTSSETPKLGANVGPADFIWALNDVSFEIECGEVVGLVGRNGAGKSTLFKILSRITEPTSGRIEINGRIASLIELGTGFHPELTGRENIYLSGAILGMKKAEIAKNFEEIVAFSEIEKFIDTPVKRYSSGMYVRLAFAVAAHFEAEILIVDEVLAVGDVAFQKKCLKKIQETAEQGKTILFVSHNPVAVANLCRRGLLISQGCLLFDGKADQALARYLNLMGEQERRTRAEFPTDPYKNAQFTSVAVQPLASERMREIDHTAAVDIELTYRVDVWEPGTYVCVEIMNEMGQRVFWSSDVNTLDDLAKNRRPGHYRAIVEIPGHYLRAGSYHCSFAIYNPTSETAFDFRENVVQFAVIDKTSLLAQLGISFPVPISIPARWRIIEDSGHSVN